MTTQFLTAFITMVVLMDPLGSVPTFLALSSGYDAAGRRQAARHAVLAAFALIFGFAFGGRVILRYLNVSLQALTVAGGLLLALVALEMLRGHYDDPGVTDCVRITIGTRDQNVRVIQAFKETAATFSRQAALAHS